MSALIAPYLKRSITALLCLVAFELGVFAQQPVGKSSLYDNLIYSTPNSAKEKTGDGTAEEVYGGRKVVKPSGTMLSGTVDDANYHLELANLAMLEGNNLEAGWQYFYVTQQHPEFMLAQEGLALSMAKTGNVPTAHKMFRRLYEQNPREVRYRIQLAASEFHLGEYEKSLQHLVLPAGISERYDSLYLRGLCYYAVGNVREAIGNLQAAHDVELGRPDPIKAMAEIFASRKMKEPVEKLLKKLEQLSAPDEYTVFRRQAIFDFLTED